MDADKISFTMVAFPAVHSAERTLLVALLQRAILDLDPPARMPNIQQHRREAIDWISNDGDDVFSFRWICQALSLNADIIRKCILLPGKREEECHEKDLGADGELSLRGGEGLKG